jgi:hypothetical protein
LIGVCVVRFGFLAPRKLVIITILCTNGCGIVRA